MHFQCLLLILLFPSFYTNWDEYGIDWGGPVRLEGTESVHVEGLPDILSLDEKVELNSSLECVRTGESEEYMLAKYMIAKVFVHGKVIENGL